jgi:RNA polymerase sigma-70 factor (ECF subfamily)
MLHDEDPRWQRLAELLGPIHRAAAGTARRLEGSPEDGDDLLQEAVLRAYERLGTLRDETRFRPWFFAVLLSIHRSRRRRAFWRRFVSLGEAFASGTEPAAEPETGEDEWQRARRLNLALGRLPAVQREAIVLHDAQGFSVQEIAAMQNVSESAVKTRLSRGRSRLRRFYLRRGWVGDARAASRPHADVRRLISEET